MRFSDSPRRTCDVSWCHVDLVMLYMLYEQQHFLLTTRRIEGLLTKLQGLIISVLVCHAALQLISCMRAMLYRKICLRPCRKHRNRFQDYRMHVRGMSANEPLNHSPREGSLTLCRSDFKLWGFIHHPKHYHVNCG